MIKKILLSSLLASSMAMAADGALVTHVELGYVETSGNTETQTFLLDAKAKKSIDKHQFALSVDGQYATENKDETKNKYVSELTYDYAITERFSFGYLLGYKDDKFSGYEYQLYTGPGAKYTPVKTQTQDLSLEGNILYSQDQVDDETADVNSYSAFRVGAVYMLQILENSKLNQELIYRGSFEESENYFAYSKTSLTSKLSDMFSAGLSYKVDYANIAPVGKENTDKTLTANLIVDF